MLNESAILKESYRFMNESKLTEFSSRHIDGFMAKLNQIDMHRYSAIDEPIRPLLRFGEGIDLTTKKKLKPIKSVYPNSNVSVDFSKSVSQYFKIDYAGYKFPMQVDFNKKVVLKVYVSFTEHRPDNIRNVAEFHSP